MNDCIKEKISDWLDGALNHEDYKACFLTESRLIEEIDELKKSQHELKQLIQLADKKIETIRQIKDSNDKLIRKRITECATQIASNDIINALIDRLKNENH